MTPEEYAHGVIAKANAGMFDPSSGTGLYNAIVKAVSAAVASEREACAKECDFLYDLFYNDLEDSYGAYGAKRCAVAIRARGSK